MGAGMQKLYPALTPAQIDSVYADYGWDGRDRVVMNVVATLDGRARLAGRSQGIGSATDQRLLRRLRAGADAVLHGAGTLRAERVDPGVPARLSAERLRRGLTAHPLTVLLAGASPLRLEGRIREIGPERLIVFCPRDSAEEDLGRLATVYPVDGRRPDPSHVVRTLRSRHGVKTLLVEGGPHVYASFLAADLIDEVFCTIAPLVAGAQPFTWFEGGPVLPRPLRLQLLSIYEDGGELYLRYEVLHAGTGPGGTSAV